MRPPNQPGGYGAPPHGYGPSYPAPVAEPSKQQASVILAVVGCVIAVVAIYAVVRFASDATAKTADDEAKFLAQMRAYRQEYEAARGDVASSVVFRAARVDCRNGLPTRTWTRRNKKGDVTKTGKYSPLTMNDWLAVARVIFAAATLKYDLPRDPMLGVEDFEVTHRTYTKEQPNALPPDKVSTWLAIFREKYPQHYAMVFLGLVLGHRPSTLRPLRRKGRERDIDLDAKKPRLLVRRSHTMLQEVWDQTKTKTDQDIAVEKSVAEVLRWHVRTQLVTEAQKRSDLLFPNERGGFRAKSCLDKPFRAVTTACKLAMRITPRALRRTFQDLTRAKKVEAVVAKAISGHATDAMRVHYSTAHDAEVEAAMGKVARAALAPRRERAGKTARRCG